MKDGANPQTTPPAPTNDLAPVPEPAATSGSTQRPIIIAALYLGGFFIPFSPLVGIVLAYVWRGDEETQEWEHSHFTYLIRTFWVGLVLSVAMTLLFFGIIFSVAWAGGNGEPPVAFFLTFITMMIVWGLAAIWFLVRCVLSLAKAGSGKPMPDPETLLF